MLNHVIANRDKFRVARGRTNLAFAMCFISNFCQAGMTQASGSGQNYCSIC